MTQVCIHAALPVNFGLLVSSKQKLTMLCAGQRREVSLCTLGGTE